MFLKVCCVCKNWSVCLTDEKSVRFILRRIIHFYQFYCTLEKSFYTLKCSHFNLMK